MSSRLLSILMSSAVLSGVAPTLSLAQDQTEPEGEFEVAPITVDAPHGWDPEAGAADRAASIYVDREDLVRRNAQTIRDVFAGESGIQVGGGHPAAQKVYVHGLEETALSVTIDGSRQNRAIFHHTSTNLYDPSLFKAARVDPGVAPADAGPAALGGSIAFETVDVGDLLKPGEDYGAFLTGSFNTNGNVFATGASAYGRFEGFEGLGFIRVGIGDDYEAGNGQTVRGTETDFLTMLFKGAFEAETGYRFEFSGERVVDDAARPFRANIGAIPGRPEPIVRDYRLERHNYVLSFEDTTPEGLLDPRFVLAYSLSEVRVPVPFGSIGQNGGWTGKLENRFALGGENSITAGFDFYKDKTEYTDPTTVPALTEKATNVGFYTQARLEPLEDLLVSAGFRADHQWFTGVSGYKEENFGLSGNVSAEYTVADLVTFNAGYSNVFGGIALAESFIFNPAWNYTGIGPVRSENFVLGVEVNYEGFTASAGVFRSDFEDARDVSFGGGPYIPFDFRSEGYTLGAGYNWKDGFVRVSFTDTEVTSGGALLDNDTLQYFGASVGTTLTVEAAHTFADIGLVVGGFVDLAFDQDEILQPFGNQSIDGYTVVSLYTSWTPPQADFLTLRLDALNLFNETYAQRGTYGQEFSTVVPLYEPGRSFLLSTRLEL